MTRGFAGNPKKKTKTITIKKKEKRKKNGFSTL